MSPSILLAAITLAGNFSNGATLNLGPAIPTSITQICAGACVQVDLGNVQIFPNGCMEFVPGLQAPGPFACTDLCVDHEEFCIINGTRTTNPSK